MFLGNSLDCIVLLLVNHIRTNRPGRLFKLIAKILVCKSNNSSSKSPSGKPRNGWIVNSIFLPPYTADTIMP